MRRIFFVLLPDVVLLDVAGAADAFRAANQQAPNSYTLEFIAPQTQLKTGVGLEVTNLAPLPPELPEGSMVVVTGLVGPRINIERPGIQRVVRWLRSVMSDPSLSLMCVCAGSVIAAAAGLL